MKDVSLHAGDLFRFLIGDRQAILKIAAARASLGLSILFVLSAALARRYDRADFFAEPWHLLMPLAVSLFNASVLFLMIQVLFLRRAEGKPGVAASYRAFLTLFWMTAPLAWLYAIPFERFLEPLAATTANLWLLLIVALWRVVLYARIVSVLLDVSRASAGWLVMFFGDLVAVGLMFASPKPIVAVMGGLMHAPEDVLILEVGFFVLFLGVLSLPVWLIGLLLTAFSQEPRWTVDREEDDPGARPLLVFALASVLFWLPILPFTQAEQRLATRVDRDLAAGEIAGAVQTMASHSKDHFPPHFNPRPIFWQGRETPSVWQVLHEMHRQEAPRWARDLYLEKADRILRSARPAMDDQLDWARAATESEEVFLLSLEVEPDFYFSLGRDADPSSELARLVTELRRRAAERSDAPEDEASP